MKTYKEQAEEIKRLTERISKKAEGFAAEEHKSQYFEDLLYVISELKEIDNVLSDKYLK
jgi:hypothetical protein